MIVEASECKLQMYKENHSGTVRRVEFETVFDPREIQKNVLVIDSNDDHKTFLVIDVFDPMMRELEDLRKENAGLREFVNGYLRGED